jgi:CRISPR-associated protein Csb2
VAVHRALIRIIGDGAPPLVTGIYPQPASRPANRLAVQVVDDSMPVDLPAGVKCAIALMIPAGVEAGDLAVLAAAVENLTILYGPSGSVQPLQVAGPVAMTGGRFWRPRPVGTVRVWGTQPPAVPDVRGVRGVEWTFAHAALLSVGFVLKSRLGPVPGRRDARYLNVVDAVTAAGAAVLDVRPERTTGVQDYAHTVHAHAVIRPYRARLVLGDLATDQALLSIGQSRHLGGGLLVPVDLPEDAPMSDAALPPQGRAR